MGYDTNLSLISSRGTVLSLHCDTNSLTLSPLSFDAEIYEEAMEGPILSSDKPKTYTKEECILFTQRNGYAGASIVAKNVSLVTKLAITMTISGKNVMSHTGALAVTVMIPPGEAKVIHHLFPEVEPGGWSYKQQVSFQRTKA
jgi:hypothetical protein